MYLKELNGKLKYYFETYDSFDLIVKFSSLNLEFENQNKNLLISYVVIYGLFNFNKDKPKASFKTIKEIIKILNETLSLTQLTDPSECPFVEKVYFGKEYNVFNGINSYSGFYANTIIDCLLYRKNILNSNLKERLLKYIEFLLDVSNSVYLKSHVKHDYASHEYVPNLLFPNDINLLSDSLIFKKDFFKKLISEEEFNKYFKCSFDKLSLNDCLNDEYPFYYSCPFLEFEDYYLLLDPTCIGYFIKQLSLRIADEYSQKEIFISEINSHAYEVSFEIGKMISGVGVSNRPLSSIECQDYRIETYSISETKAIVFIYVCKNREQLISPNLDREINESFKFLNKRGFENSDIYSIVILNSFLGSIGFSSNYEFINHPLFIGCAELHYVQLNEKDNPYFLESFSKFFNFYFGNDSSSLNLSHINLIALLHEKKYDFYIDDQINIRKVFLNLGFDFIYNYVIEYQKEQFEYSAVLEGINIPLKLVKYENNLYFPNPLFCIINNAKPVYVKINDFGIWVISEIDNNDGFLVSRIIGYWLIQVKSTLSKYINTNYVVKIKQTENDLSFRLIDNNKCCFYYTRNYLESFSNDDNNGEVEICINLLKCFGLLMNDVAEELYNASIKKYKKILYMIDSAKSPFLVPVKDKLAPLRVSKILCSIFDDVGGDFLESKSIKTGALTNPCAVLNELVGNYFSMFENYLVQFKWADAIKFCYLHCENLLQELLIFQDNMKHQIDLYPEKIKSIKENFNSLNVASVSTRFVIEYLSAVKTSGNKIMDEIDLQYLISLVSTIIEKAKLSDSFKFGLVSEMNFLKSGRIGYDHTNIDKFNSLVNETASFDTTHPLEKIDFERDFPFAKDMDNAYLFEHGFTTKDLLNTEALLTGYGSTIDNEVKSATIEQLLEFKNMDQPPLISDEIFLKVLDFISLSCRGKYYDGVISNRELHPWKYNREWSLMRKPLIKLENEFIWGNRNVFNSYLFTMQTIRNGKEHSHLKGKQSIKVLNGKIIDFSGNSFNDYCIEYLRKLMPEIFFEKQVKSINNKKIEKNEGETLGDIDILGIDKDKKRIYLIETKNFFYSRDPSELNIEILEMFIGDSKRKSFLEKELNRKKWFDTHLDDVIKHYSLENGNWKILYTFLTNKPLISADFSTQKINHVCLKKITLKYLRSLK